MVVPRGTNALLLTLVLLLVAGLAVLATLQYRWIDQVSDAERQRMRGNLDFAARRLGDDLRGELEPLVRDFSEAESAADAYARTSHRELIAAVYVVDEGRLQLFDPATGGLRDAEWPALLDPIRERLEPGRGPGPPFVAEIPAIVAARRGPPESFPPPPRRVTIVQLSRAAIARLMPALVERHFPGAYDVALMSGHDVLYRSDPSFPANRTQPDLEAELPMFGGGGMPPREPRLRPFDAGPRPDAFLRLVVRRHDGGVDAIIASARRRNLAISFGILFILGATVAMLLALLRRADRLQQQQSEFVAAISHELNTPVAALRSAGENLKDGLVADREKLARYGETIVRESARLGDMIAQVLELAGMQSRNTRRVHEPVDVAAVVDDAIAQCGWLVAGSPIRIETDVAVGLPPVNGNADALTRAVQNLIANAIRHGGSGNWVGVRAHANGKGVTITVEDRGPGIDHRDAAHLFEPFYRGRNSGSVRGSGLGLAIVKRIVDAHGGSVTIDKRRGGAAFAIHLPPAVEHA